MPGRSAPDYSGDLQAEIMAAVWQLNRSGRPYKPSAIAGYTRDLEQRVVPAFGPRYLAALTLPDVQRWADTLTSVASDRAALRIGADQVAPPPLVVEAHAEPGARSGASARCGQRSALLSLAYRGER